MDEQYALQMEQVSKSYGDNQVLKNVSLSVKKGEIHALIGENGAGKSTLMNILFGMSVIRNTGGFSGSVRINGNEVNFASPNDAMAAGVGMVHQEFMLIPGFTITENIKVGREDTIPSPVSRIFGRKLEKLNRKKMNAAARTALDSIGMDIDQHVRVAGLPVGYMQFVEIAREIDKENINLLVFDEPTAVLTESEADRLLEVMRSIAKKGIAIIFITHRLSEVMNAADGMTVLRDGEIVATKPISETDIPEIAQMMVGRRVEKLVDDVGTWTAQESDIAVQIRDMWVDMPGESVNGVDLDIYKGEIFGIGGLAGQGKVGIPNGIMGMFPSEGDVNIFGEKLVFSKRGDALKKGVAFVSEDRRGVGLLLDESIEHNTIFSAMTVKGDYLANLGFARLLSPQKANRFATEMIDLLDIRCTGPKQRVGSLSGGNQQKVCLAAALALEPKLLMVSEPTRGIDIGAKKLILEYLVKLRRETGVTIIMVSSELGELRSVCNRIAIVSDGKISRILEPDAPDVEFGLAMSAVQVDGEVG